MSKSKKYQDILGSIVPFVLYLTIICITYGLKPEMMKKASHYNVFQRPVVFSKPMSFRNSLQATLDFCAQYTLSLHLWMSFNTLFISFMFTFSAAQKSVQKWLVCDNNKTQKFLSQNCFKCACGIDFVYFDRISANHKEIFMVNAIFKICIWNLAVNLINNLFFSWKKQATWGLYPYVEML